MDDINNRLEPIFSYFLSAFLNFCQDNSFTPFIVIYAANILNIPKKYIREDGYIILNISHLAAHNLKVSHYDISFQARFEGKSVTFNRIPLKLVYSIYIKECSEVKVLNGFHDISEPDINESTNDISINENKISEPSLPEIQVTNNVVSLDNYRLKASKKDQ